MTMVEKGSGKQGGMAVWRATAEALSCGRTLDEQMESIRRYGSHGASPGGCKIVCVNGHSGVLQDPTLKRSSYGH